MLFLYIILFLVDNPLNTILGNRFLALQAKFLISRSNFETNSV
jgi:hypothetical protein